VIVKPVVVPNGYVVVSKPVNPWVKPTVAQPPKNVVDVVVSKPVNPWVKPTVAQPPKNVVDVVIKESSPLPHPQQRPLPPLPPPQQRPLPPLPPPPPPQQRAPPPPQQRAPPPPPPPQQRAPPAPPPPQQRAPPPPPPSQQRPPPPPPPPQQRPPPPPQPVRKSNIELCNNMVERLRMITKQDQSDIELQPTQPAKSVEKPHTDTEVHPSVWAKPVVIKSGKSKSNSDNGTKAFPRLGTDVNKNVSVKDEDNFDLEMISGKSKKYKSETLIKASLVRRRCNRVCLSVTHNTKCKNGDNCPHAHVESDLVVNVCKFGRRCTKGDKCTFKHDDESTNKYLCRMGLRKTVIHKAAKTQVTHDGWSIA
jgi:hypothetical protein